MRALLTLVSAKVLCAATTDSRSRSTVRNRQRTCDVASVLQIRARTDACRERPQQRQQLRADRDDRRQPRGQSIRLTSRGTWDCARIDRDRLPPNGGEEPLEQACRARSTRNPTRSVGPTQSPARREPRPTNASARHLPVLHQSRASAVEVRTKERRIPSRRQARRSTSARALIAVDTIGRWHSDLEHSIPDEEKQRIADHIQRALDWRGCRVSMF